MDLRKCFITVSIISYNIYLRIYRYASVSVKDRVIIFGVSWNSPIGVYKSRKWSTIGQLEHSRFSYGPVEQNGMVMIIGGKRSNYGGARYINSLYKIGRCIEF